MSLWSNEIFAWIALLITEVLDYWVSTFTEKQMVIGFPCLILYTYVQISL